MQTFHQRFSRLHHRRHGGRGPLWAERYRACLLADDAALLAAVAWVERGPGAGVSPAASSRGRRGTGAPPPRLAPLPIRGTADGEPFPADELPLGLPPSSDDGAEALFERFTAGLSERSLEAYGDALGRGWSLGHADSLIEPLARLGRVRGRGRSRQLRELDDEWGLCGVWG